MLQELLALSAHTTNFFLLLLELLIFVRVLMSWLPTPIQGHIAEFIYSATDPVLAFFQRLPLRWGMFDFSALAALLVIDFVRLPLLNLIFGSFIA